MDKVIKHVHFQITRNCNLRCSFCGQWGKKGFFADSFGTELSLDEWKNIIDGLEKYREKTNKNIRVTVWGGEPLVSPLFDDILVLLKDKGFETEIITNGVLIDKHKDVIKRCVDRLYISIDGVKDVHNSIRGEGVYEQVVSNIRELEHKNITIMSVITENLVKNLKAFLDELNKLNIKELYLQDMIGLKKNEVAEYKAWMKRVFDIDAVNIDSWENNDEIDFSDELYRALAEIDVQDYSFKISHKSHNTKKNEHCMSPFNHAHIAWNGNVIYCTDFYDFAAGNVKDDSLENIFCNAKSDKYREEILKGNCVTCRHCSWIHNEF